MGSGFSLAREEIGLMPTSRYEIKRLNLRQIKRAPTIPDFFAELIGGITIV